VVLLAACGPRPPVAFNWTADFRTVAGEPFELEDRGLPVLLVFWSPWAQPCMPLLRDIGVLADRAQVVTVMVDAFQPEIDRFVAGDLLVVVPAADTVPARYRVELLPTVLLLDGRGRINVRFEGYGTDMVEAIGQVPELPAKRGED